MAFAFVDEVFFFHKGKVAVSPTLVYSAEFSWLMTFFVLIFMFPEDEYHPCQTNNLVHS